MNVVRGIDEKGSDSELFTDVRDRVEHHIPETIPEELKSDDGLRWKEKILSDFDIDDWRGFEGFNWNLSDAYWSGLVVKDPGPLSGTLIAGFWSGDGTNKPTIVILPWFKSEGKIHEVPADSDTGTLYPKYNGVVIQNFNLPNGQFWGKTRTIEYIDRNSLYNRNFDLLLDESGHRDSVNELCSGENVAVFGMLYGNLLPGGYTDYDFTVKYRAFEVLDLRRNEFLGKDCAETLFSQYQIPHVNPISPERIGKTIERHGRVWCRTETGLRPRYKVYSPNDPADKIQESVLKYWDDT